MARLSAALAASKGGETAIIDDDGSVTWRAYDEHVNRCLNGLRSRGHEPGSTVAVFGCGGVGLNVIQGARLAGASRIIAVDLSAQKLELAKKFGATDQIDPEQDAVKQIKTMTGGRGVDYAFEVVGSGKLVEECFKAARSGGTGRGPTAPRAHL